MERIGTVERWARAAERAAVAGVQVRRVAGVGYVVSSGTDADTAYVVTLTGCQCAAAVNGDPVCRHRAALAVALGIIAVPTPVEVATVATATPVRMDGGCGQCGGEGFYRKASATFPVTTYRVNCAACRGTGQRPVERPTRRRAA